MPKFSPYDTGFIIGSFVGASTWSDSNRLLNGVCAAGVACFVCLIIRMVIKDD